MARLNEAPMSSDSIETLRRKMLRQNRDLAKSNNLRALRIRELEGECALMLSENLELRGRILELERQVESNGARRIADQAMTIKAKLEAQLTEWTMLVSGLGSEPPMKRRSPQIRRRVEPRVSFAARRPSPSQRRLRDMAREIEELGSISEKPSSRQSLNPEQIRALQYKADAEELQSPSKAIPKEHEQLHIDTSAWQVPADDEIPSPRSPLQPPPSLASPKPKKSGNLFVPSPDKKKTDPTGRPYQPALPQPSSRMAEEVTAAVKAGSKRKFLQDEAENAGSRQVMNENAAPRIMTDKFSIREKAGGRTLKELAHLRKETKDKQSASGNGIGDGRKPLAAKSTNDDLGSPRKTAKSIPANKLKPVSKERTRSRAKSDVVAPAEAPPTTKARPPAVYSTSDLAASLPEPALMSPNSPETASGVDDARGDTPPPADISSSGETSRPSRRNRATVSYAEPNLRDKMRRPTKELFDAVTGEGKYARRTSHCEQPPPLEGSKVRHETEAGDPARCINVVHDELIASEPGTVEAGALAKKSSAYEPPASSVTERPRRSSAMSKLMAKLSVEANEDETGDADVYDFTSSSPQIDQDESVETDQTKHHQGAKTRRQSAAIDNEKSQAGKERSASRRRSMML